MKELNTSVVLSDAIIFDKYFTILSQAVDRRCSVKMKFLEILQNSQENTCVWVFVLIKLQVLACKFIK